LIGYRDTQSDANTFFIINAIIKDYPKYILCIYFNLIVFIVIIFI